ncbi:type IV pilus assembly protein PilE [Desulfacinum hydrothermale DSM 13146]|uniref:Type IV pilus assembly protein PilE n=2 Tax=Desulfacinum hydrothermale TaxID=109258 RepID=A0A1W1X6R7_9BACT|nr:type IV pilus assembly protein PilE [Desulfacinum hydrothermale DSM 13146]
MFKIPRGIEAKGFSLVELMVTVAIMAILAAVAVPAYINHVNRVKQSEAASYLMTARLEQEEFFADNNRYASTITCLPSFGGACGTQKVHLKYYTFFVENVSGNYYRMAATRKIFDYAATDKLIVSASTESPQVLNEEALGFSLFKLLFD